MIKKAFFGVLILLTIAALAWAGPPATSDTLDESCGRASLSKALRAGVFYWKNLRGVAPALREPARDITRLLPENGQTAPSQAAGFSGENQTDFPLKLPAGFAISVFAKNLPLARVMLFDSLGNLWLSRTRDGAITMLEIKNGQVVAQNDVFRNLKNPHGLALDPENPLMLYFAEENKISRVLLYTEAAPEKIADLPFGAGHSTRTLLFGRDPSTGSGQAGRLYVAIGSSCNVCAEKDSRRAKIFSLNKDGSDFREFARGLRNSVFLANHPETGKIWATEMGRDLLGDNIPPEEINIIEAENPATGLGVKNYGWPYCYSQNVHDDNFDPEKAVTCEGKTPPLIEIQAHSAPLGLAFVPADSNWPEEYKNNLLVSYHGSWNRSVPTGYKIVRFKLDALGGPSTDSTSSPQAGSGQPPVEDFITGWLQGSAGDAALGRPADIVFHDGAMYVTDDKAGVIYKVVYLGK